MLFLSSRQLSITETALTVLLFVCLAGEAGAAIRSVNVYNPRAFGYMIGDVFKQRIQIELDDPWKMDINSLPRDGRVDIWLERRVVHFDERRITKGTQYQLELAYQIFNAANKTVEIFTPQLELRVANAEKQMPVFIQALGVTLVPVTRNNTHQTLNYLELQPPAKPPSYKPDLAYVLLATGCAGLLFSLFILGYVFAELPGVRRTRGPFARAYSRLRKLQKSYPDTEIHQQALRYLHQAFNETVGRVVLADDLDTFFIEQPHHALLRKPIERLFNQSRREFFEPGPDSVDRDLTWLLKLCRQCRDVERGLC